MRFDDMFNDDCKKNSRYRRRFKDESYKKRRESKKKTLERRKARKSKYQDYDF